MGWRCVAWQMVDARRSSGNTPRGWHAPGIATVEVQYGVYAFAAAMLLLHLVTCRLETLMRHRENHAI
jgi:hypothetical protein